MSTEPSSDAVIYAPDWSNTELKGDRKNYLFDGSLDTSGYLSLTDGKDKPLEISFTGVHMTYAGNEVQVDQDQAKLGNASALFDGNNDFIDVPNHPDFDFGQSDFTIESWVRFQNTTGTQTVASKYQNGGVGWIFVAAPSEGRLRLYSDGWNSTTAAASPFEANRWYHVAVARTGGKIKFFVDGSQIGEDQPAASSYNGGPVPFRVGKYGTGDAYMNGWIDELRVSKGVSRYTANFTPQTSEYAPDHYTKLLLHMNGQDSSKSFPNDSYTQAKKADLSRVRLITNDNPNMGYRIEVTEDGTTWKTVADKTTGGLKREWQDFEFTANGIQRLRIVPVGYGDFYLHELQVFEAPKEEKNFLFVRDYDFRGNITSESNVLYEVWESRPELKVYFPDAGKKGVVGRWKDKTMADWAKEEGWFEDPRLLGYRPQEEWLTPELKDAFDSRKDLQARFTEMRFDNDTGLGWWAERFGSAMDPRLESYRPGRVQDKEEAQGSYVEKGMLTQNLAPGAKIASSSSYNNSSMHPLAAIDGKENTRWLSSGYVRKSSDTEYFTLDLGKEVSLGMIRLDTGAQASVGVTERMRSFKVSLSSDGVNFRELKAIENLLYPGWITMDMGGEKTRYVKFHEFDTDGRYYAAIAEVEVYGIVERNETVQDITQNGVRTRTVTDEIGVVGEEKWDSSGRKISSKTRSALTENLALGRSVSYSSQYNGNWHANRVVDGKETPWAWMSSSTTTPEWIQADLGSIQKASRIHMNARHPDTLEYALSSFTLKVSSDGTNWETIDAQSGGNLGYDWTWDFAEKSIRYVRVENLRAKHVAGSDYYAFLTELEVFGRNYTESTIEYQDLGNGITGKIIRDKKGFVLEERKDSQGRIIYERKRTGDSPNIARGKKAAASSYYNDNYRPGRAVDGRTNPPSSYGVWLAASAGTDEWWQLDLGRLEKFSQILINTQYEGNQRTSQFRLQVSKDGVNWEALAEEAGLTQGRDFRYVFPEKEARFIRLDRVRSSQEIESPYNAILGEVEVYQNQYDEAWTEYTLESGNSVKRTWADPSKTILLSEEITDSQGKVLSKKERNSIGNMARGSSVKASSQYSSGYAAWKTTDGLYSAQGSWSSGYADGRDEWVEVDLGRPMDLTHILMDTQADQTFGENTRIKDFQVKVSEDGTNWTTVVQESDLSWSGAFEYTFLPKKARFIRIDGIHGASGISSNYYASIREIEVEATELQNITLEEVSDSEGRLLKQIERTREFGELSLGKTAWATTDNESTGKVAMRALDGDPTTSWQAHGNTTIENAFVIDLWKSAEINELRVLTQFPTAGHYVKSFRVSLSQDGVNWSVAAEPSGATGPKEWVVPIPPLKIFGVEIPRFARYVKIDKIDAWAQENTPNNDFLQEVRVFGRSFVTVEKEYDVEGKLIRETKTGGKNPGSTEYAYHPTGVLSEMKHYLPPIEEWRPLRFDSAGTSHASIIDGNEGSGDTVSWSANEMPKSFTAKLEKPSSITKLRLKTAGDNTSGHSFTVEASKDGINWFRIVDKAWPGVGGWIEDEFPPVQAQYLRVTGHFDSGWGKSLTLYEIEAYELASSVERRASSVEHFDQSGNLISEENALFNVWQSDAYLRELFPDPRGKSRRTGKWFGKTLLDWAREEGYKHYTVLQSYAPSTTPSESGANREILPGLRQVLDETRPFQDRFRKTGNKDSELIQYARNRGYREDSRLFYYGPYGPSEEVARKHTFETKFDKGGNPSILILKDENGRRIERRFNQEGRLVAELPELVLLWEERPELFKNYTDSSSLHSWATTMGYKDPMLAQILSDYSPYAIGGQDTNLPYLDFSDEIYDPLGFVKESKETLWNLSGGQVRTNQTFYNALGYETRIVNEQGDFSYTLYLDRDGRLIRKTDQYGNVDWIPVDVAVKNPGKEEIEDQIIRNFLLIHGRLPSAEELSQEKRFIEEKGRYASQARLTLTKNENFSSTTVGEMDPTQVKSYGGTEAELSEITKRANSLKEGESQTRIEEEKLETKHLGTLTQRIFRRLLGRDPKEEGTPTELEQMTEKLRSLNSVLSFERFIKEEYNKDAQGKTEHQRRTDELKASIDSVYNSLALFFGFPSQATSLGARLEALLKLLKSDPAFELKELTLTQLDKIKARLLELIGEDIHFGQSAVYALHDVLNRNCERVNQGNPEGTASCKNNLPSLKELTELALFSDILTGVVSPEFIGNLQFSAYTLKVIAEVLGLKVAGLKINWEELKAILEQGYPVIANIEERHFVVVTGIGSDTVTFVENGITRIKPASEFQARWFGTVLVDEKVLTDPNLTHFSLNTKVLSTKELLKVKGAGWFKKLFKKIKKFFQKVAQAIVKFLQKVVRAVTKFFTGVFGQKVGGFLASIVNTPFNFLLNSFHYMAQGDFKGLLKYWGQVALQIALMVVVAIVAPYILGALFAFFGAILQGIGAFLGAVGGFLANTVPLLGQVLGGALQFAGKVLVHAGQFLSRVGSQMMTQAKQLFQNLKDQGLKGIFKQFKDRLLDQINPLRDLKIGTEGRIDGILLPKSCGGLPLMHIVSCGGEGGSLLTQIIDPLKQKLGEKLVKSGIMDSSFMKTLVKIGNAISLEFLKNKIDKKLEKSKMNEFMKGIIRTVAHAGVDAISNGVMALATVATGGAAGPLAALGKVGAVLGKVGAVLGRVGQAVKAVASVAWNAVKATGSFLWNATKSIGSAIGRGLQFVGSKIVDGFQAIGRGLGQAWDSTKSFISNAWTKITGRQPPVNAPTLGMEKSGWVSVGDSFARITVDPSALAREGIPQALAYNGNIPTEIIRNPGLSDALVQKGRNLYQAAGDGARLTQVHIDEFGNAVFNEIGNLPQEIQGPLFSGLEGLGAENGDLLGRAAYDALIEPQRYLLGLPSSLQSGSVGRAGQNPRAIADLGFDTFVNPQAQSHRYFYAHPDHLEFLVGAALDLVKGDPSRTTRNILNIAIDKAYPNLPDNIFIEFARTGSISAKTVANTVLEEFSVAERRKRFAFQLLRSGSAGIGSELLSEILKKLKGRP